MKTTMKLILVIVTFLVVIAAVTMVIPTGWPPPDPSPGTLSLSC